jgi:hypothetical protein
MQAPISSSHRGNGPLCSFPAISIPRWLCLNGMRQDTLQCALAAASVKYTPACNDETGTTTPTSLLSCMIRNKGKVETTHVTLWGCLPQHLQQGAGEANPIQQHGMRVATQEDCVERAMPGLEEGLASSRIGCSVLFPVFSCRIFVEQIAQPVLQFGVCVCQLNKRDWGTVVARGGTEQHRVQGYLVPTTVLSEASVRIDCDMSGRSAACIPRDPACSAFFMLCLSV